MPPRRTSVVRRIDQKKVLTSPLRQELLDVLARVGKVSLAELGALLGRPADGLYYHVRLLARVGLVQSAGERTTHGRREALYRAAASQFALQYTPSTAAHTRVTNSIVTAMLRLGIRDFRRAMTRGAVRLEGSGRDLWALRTTGRLRTPQLRRVNRAIEGLIETATRHDPGGRLYAVTVLLTPLDHRNNATGRRPRKRAG